VFWIDASSSKSIEISLRGLSGMSTAQNFDLGGSVQSVLQWISSIQEEWLIVFDNADLHPETVAKFFPPGNRGNILITSRNRSMGRIVRVLENSIEINEMEELDAITLLLKASFLDASAEHLQAAREIVIELGCIPLAVDHAGDYIAAGRCNITTYLRQFSLHRQTLMTDVTFRGASNYSQTVYGTWDLSFKQIEQRASGKSTTGNAQAAQSAILILQICAFYHYSNISKEIFQSAAEEFRNHQVDHEVAEKLPQAITLLDHTLLALDNDGQWDEFVFGQGISVLLSFSLMRKENSSGMFSVHPLVHSWSQERMTKSEQQKMCQMASTILSCAIPWRFTSQDYALRRLIFTHIKANERHRIQTGLLEQYYDDKLSNFALVMQENGDWNTAEQLQNQIIEMRKKLLGPEHLCTLLSMGNLAGIYSYQGRWNMAEQLELQVMDMRKKLLGPEHPDTLLSMGNLASTYSDQGRWNEAEQLQLQVMDVRKKLLGPENPDTLLSMEDFARICSNQERWDEAEHLELQVLDLRKKLLGLEHPDTLLSMGNLASIYSDQGRWNEAEQLELQVMEIRKKLLGPEHPDALSSMGNLASTYSNQGWWNEAEQLELQVMDIRKKLLGLEHPDTLLSMGNLASTYSHQRRWNEAEQLQVQVMNMRKKLLGQEHPDTLLSMGNLASTYSHQGKRDEAEQLQVQVDMRMKLLGEEHPDMEHLESKYSHQERRNEAEQLQVQMMNMRKKPLDTEHSDTFKGMTKHTIFRKDEMQQRKRGFKYKSWIRQRMVQRTACNFKT
jgi:tetratricopeptide (TPR) repeat protein